MPFPFRVMLNEHFSKLYQRLPGNDPLKSHVAFSLGLLTVSPSLTGPGKPTSEDPGMIGSEIDIFLDCHRRPLIGATWLRKAALLGHESASMVLARLMLASGLEMDEDRMAGELLVTAAIGDSVFAHEDLEELAPVKYQEINTAIKSLHLGPITKTSCCTSEEILLRVIALHNDMSMIVAHVQLGLEGNLRLLTNSGKTDQLSTLSVGSLKENLTHFAATINTTSLLLLLLELRIFNSDPNLGGDTPIHFAARCGNFNNLSVLLSHSAPKSWGCMFGATPLHYLFRFQDEMECKTIAESLFEKGVPVEQEAYISLETVLSNPHMNHCMAQPGTALHWAVARNHRDSVKALLAVGASPYTKNSFGRTPWDLAISARLIALLRLLDKEGKCEDLEERQKVTVQGLAGSYPLTAMLSNGRHHVERSLAMISFLLEIGAATLKDVCVLAISPVYHDLRLLRALIAAYQQAFLADHDLVRYLLNSAVITGEIQAARELLRCLPPLQSDSHTLWIFHQAVTSHDVHPESIKILETLFAHKTSDFDVNTRYSFDPTRKSDNSELVTLGSGDTLLHYAFSVCRLDLAKILLENFADPSIKNDRGMTPLGRLISLGNQQSLLALQSMIPSLNQESQPTSFAAAYPDFLTKNALTQPLVRSSILQQIVRAWESGRVHDNPDSEILALRMVLEYFAAWDPSYLQELLQMRDIATHPTADSPCDGNTILHHAASKGFASAAKLLIHHGADPFALNGFKKTPLDELTVRCWDKDFLIQEQAFAARGMPWIDSEGPVAEKLRMDFENRTKKTMEILEEAMQKDKNTAKI